MKSPMDTSSSMQASSSTLSTKASEGPQRADDAPAKVRKPYTITKQRERWTSEEHQKFLDALKLHGRAWRLIEEHIGTKTAVQIRSHAQKFFSKLEREASISGTVSATGSSPDIEIPPPRPKRKPSHPYPRKAGGASSSSRSFEEAGKSPPAVCSSFRPLGSPTEKTTWKPSSKVLQEEVEKSDLSSSLRLFGKTMIVSSDMRSNVIVEYESRKSGMPLEGEVIEEDSSPSIVEMRALKDASDSTEGESLQTEVFDVNDMEVSKRLGNAIEDKAITPSPLLVHLPHKSSRTGPQCGFTPWHPSPYTAAQQELSTHSSPLPTFWQSPSMSENAETIAQRWREDTSAAAASAMAAATMAVMSAWQQALQASIPLPHSRQNGSVVYSPVAVVQAAQNPSAEAATLLPLSPSSVEQHEAMDERETSSSDNCESNNLECVAKKRIKSSNMSNDAEGLTPDVNGNEDMQNSDSYTCSMVRANTPQVEVSNARGAENDGNSLSMFKTGALILSSRYSGAGFVPYKRPKRLKLSHVSANPVQLQEFST